MADALTVTDAAAQRARDLLARADLADGGLRVVVQSAGCFGFQAVLDLAPAPAEGEIELRANGVRVFVDATRSVTLHCATLDHVATSSGSEFAWTHASSSADSCACIAALAGSV